VTGIRFHRIGPIRLNDRRQPLSQDSLVDAFKIPAPYRHALFAERNVDLRMRRVLNGRHRVVGEAEPRFSLSSKFDTPREAIRDRHWRQRKQDRLKRFEHASSRFRDSAKASTGSKLFV